MAEEKEQPDVTKRADTEKRRPESIVGLEYGGVIGAIEETRGPMSSGEEELAKEAARAAKEPAKKKAE